MGKESIHILFAIILVSSFSFMNCSKDDSNPTEPTPTSGTVTDIDGNSYKTVRIGNQWWMAENLKVGHYRNGQPIPNITDKMEWSGTSSGACCAYENNSSIVSVYGLLYSWYAAVDTQNIAPAGWHVPTDEEWKELELSLGMSRASADSTGWRGTDQGGRLKETGLAHWSSPNLGASNASGFSALPGGGRSGYAPYEGNFYYVGTLASMWTSSAHNDTTAWYRDISYQKANVFRYYISKRNGFSIRCVKD